MRAATPAGATLGENIMSKLTVFLPVLVLVAGCGNGGGAPTAGSTGEPSGARELSSHGVASKGSDAGLSDGGGATCTTFKTSSKTCTDDYALFKDDEASCQAAGGDLNAFVANESCKAGSSDGSSYTCCPTKPSCTGGGGFGGQACKKVAVLFKEAEESCTGASIATFKPIREECDADHGTGGDLVCSCLP